MDELIDQLAMRGSIFGLLIIRALAAVFKSSLSGDLSRLARIPRPASQLLSHVKGDPYPRGFASHKWRKFFHLQLRRVDQKENLLRLGGVESSISGRFRCLSRFAEARKLRVSVVRTLAFRKYHVYLTFKRYAAQ